MPFIFRAARALALAALSFVAALALVVATEDGARAGDLAVELQCWVGSSEGPIVPRLTFDDVVKQHGCKVLVSNNSGQALSDVDFVLTFGEHPALPLTANPDFGDADPAAHFNCPSAPPAGGPGATFRPAMVLDVVTAFAGFPSATVTSGTDYPYDLPYAVHDRCFDYHAPPRAAWRISVAAGATATLRVEFRSGYLAEDAQFETALRLEVSNLPLGLSVAPRTVPIDVLMPDRPLQGAILAGTLPQSPAYALAGSLWIGTSHSSRRGSHSQTSVDLYLPYLRPAAGGGLELATDGGYDPLAGHLLVFDPSELELNASYQQFGGPFAARFQDAATSEDSVTVGDLPWPLVRVADDHYHVDVGHLSGNRGDTGGRQLWFAWVAAYSQDPAVQAFFASRTTVTTGRVCGRSDQASELCVTATSPLYPEATFLTQLANIVDHTSLNNIAETESSAATPFTVLSAWTIPTFTPWRDGTLTTVLQVPRDSLGHQGETLGVRKSGGLHIAQPLQGAYAVVAADGSHESDLLARVVPVATESDWVDIGAVTGGNAIPVPAGASEIRVVCEPSRYGVRNFISRSECDVIVNYRVPRDARPSIDGSSYVGQDMTRASLGSHAVVRMRDGDGVDRLVLDRAFNVEVDGGSRYSLSLLRAESPSEYAIQRWSPLMQDRTTGQYASVGCAFGNLGLDNVRGPLVMVLDWPVGYALTSPDDDPAHAVRVLYGDQTLAAQGQNWGNALGPRVPEDRYSLTLDPFLHRLTITFAGPRADGSFPGADQVALPLDYSDARWVGVRLDGQHMPGVDRFPEWRCQATVGESLAPDGTTVLGAVRDLGVDVPFRILGAPAPVLGGGSQPGEVPSGGAWTTTLDVRNAAYDAAGQHITNGAALSARDSVVYYRVPRDGDIEAALQGGPLALTFTQATSGDARPIWVASTEAPARPTAPGLPLDPDWRLCATGGASCDAGALAVLGLSPSAVRWVAFELGELLVTDAEPRGVAPSGDTTRSETPYLSYVALADVASGPGGPPSASLPLGGVRARPLVYFVSGDTLPHTAEVDRYDVIIRQGCEACDDSDMCTTDTCDPATNTCISEPVACGDEAGIFAPVSDASGQVVGAIRCERVAGELRCDVGPDTDGDGRPNLIVYPDLGGACAP